MQKFRIIYIIAVISTLIKASGIPASDSSTSLMEIDTSEPSFDQNLPREKKCGFCQCRINPEKPAVCSECDAHFHVACLYDSKWFEENPEICPVCQSGWNIPVLLSAIRNILLKYLPEGAEGQKAREMIGDKISSVDELRAILLGPFQNFDTLVSIFDTLANTYVRSPDEIPRLNGKINDAFTSALSESMKGRDAESLVSLHIQLEDTTPEVNCSLFLTVQKAIKKSLEGMDYATLIDLHRHIQEEYPDLDLEIHSIFADAMSRLITRMPIEDMYEALMKLPMRIFTYEALDTINKPMLYKKLTQEEVINLGICFAGLVQDESDLDTLIVIRLIVEYFDFNEEILGVDAIKEIMNLAIDSGLEHTWKSMHTFLMRYDIRLDLGHREKLAMSILKCSSIGGILRKLPLLYHLGYFGDFRDEAKQALIVYWKRNMGHWDVHKKFLELLEFKPGNADEDRVEESALEALEKVDWSEIKCQSSRAGCYLLDFYRHVIEMNNLPHEPSKTFVDKMYKCLIEMMRSGFYVNTLDIVSLLPLFESNLERDLELLCAGLKQKKQYLFRNRMDFLYSHPDITLQHMVD